MFFTYINNIENRGENQIKDAANGWIKIATHTSLLWAKSWTRNTSSGQSYKASMIINYDSGVVPDLKIPHFTTLES